MKTISFFILTILFCLAQNHQVYAMKSAVIGEKDTSIVLMESSYQQLVISGQQYNTDNLQEPKIAKVDTNCPYLFLVPIQHAALCAVTGKPDFKQVVKTMDRQAGSRTLKENSLLTEEKKKG